MRDVEVDSLRKCILKEVYGELPFSVVSSGIRVAVVVSPRAYNRLKMIEKLAIDRLDKAKRDSRLIDSLENDTSYYSAIYDRFYR